MNRAKKVADLTLIIDRLEGLRTTAKRGLRKQIVHTLKFARALRTQLKHGLPAG